MVKRYGLYGYDYLDYCETGKYVLHESYADLEVELAAYKKAKAENDERYMIERDQARAELAEVRERLAIVSGQCDIYHSERDHAVEQLAEARERLARLGEVLARGVEIEASPLTGGEFYKALRGWLVDARVALAVAKRGTDEKAE